ncbi:MAG: radical SAM protein [Acidobacteriota bacterium]
MSSRAAARAVPRRLPGLGDGATPVGLVAMARRAKTVQERRAVRVRHLASRSALNRCPTTRMPFDYTLNPYRGCEFGCVYCYARYTHDWLGLDTGAGFETELFAKADMPSHLERELARGRFTGRRIAIGTVTDPYQPAERRIGLTRRLLEVLAAAEGLRLTLTTKSDLILRDLDLLQQLAARHEFAVNMTVVTVDIDLARRLEPRAPRPDLRLAAVSSLGAAGVPAGIFAMPILPGITDGLMPLDELFSAARTAQAAFVCTGSLFVRDTTRPVLFAFIEREFPDLLPRYRKAFAHRAYLGADYRQHLATRVEALRRRHGLPDRGGETAG